MNKIQTWLSNLLSWFFNFFNLNTIAECLNLTQDFAVETRLEVKTLEEQMYEVYQRLQVLELAESYRQLHDLLDATDNISKKSKKTSKKGIVGKSKKAKEIKRQ
jgi:hypothetical protein